MGGGAGARGGHGEDFGFTSCDLEATWVPAASDEGGFVERGGEGCGGVPSVLRSRTGP